MTSALREWASPRNNMNSGGKYKIFDKTYRIATHFTYENTLYIYKHNLVANIFECTPGKCQKLPF